VSDRRDFGTDDQGAHPDAPGFGPVTVITADGSEPGMLMPDDSIAVAPKDDYEAKGIFPDTFTCIVQSFDQADAEHYLFLLVSNGIEARVAKDPRNDRWHIAIRGGLKASPLAWLLTIRDDVGDGPPVCRSELTGQHPMVTDEPLEGIEQYQVESR